MVILMGMRLIQVNSKLYLNADSLSRVRLKDELRSIWELTFSVHGGGTHSLDVDEKTANELISEFAFITYPSED